MGLVSGQIMKSGDMTVTTPVSTIGIRGTAVLIDSGTRVTRDPTGTLVVTATGTGGQTISLVFSPDGTVRAVIVTTALGETFVLDSFGGTVFSDAFGVWVIRT